MNLIAVLEPSFDGASGIVNPQFDTTAEDPLVDVEPTADPAKWTAVFDGIRYVGSSMRLISFDIVEVGMTAQALQGGPNTLSYANAPSDVSDTRGRTLAAVSVPLP